MVRRAADAKRSARRCKAGCGQLAAPGRPYCSDACLPRASRRNLGPLPAVELACVDCGAPFTTTNPLQAKRCPEHAGRQPWSVRKHTPANASKNHRRRAVLRGVDAELIVPLAIFERDGWTCQLCGVPVDRRRSGRHRWGPTLDHVVPLATGGRHVRSNVQLAHRRCNLTKGARVA